MNLHTIQIKNAEILSLSRTCTVSSCWGLFRKTINFWWWKCVGADLSFFCFSCRHLGSAILDAKTCHRRSFRVGYRLCLYFSSPSLIETLFLWEKTPYLAIFVIWLDNFRSSWRSEKYHLNGCFLLFCHFLDLLAKCRFVEFSFFQIFQSEKCDFSRSSKNCSLETLRCQVVVGG